MVSEISDAEKYYLELSKGMYVADGGRPITLDEPPFSETFKRTCLHRDIRVGDVLGVQDYQRRREVGRERLATPDEIWTFVQVAKVCEGGLLSERQLEWIM